MSTVAEETRVEIDNVTMTYESKQYPGIKGLTYFGHLEYSTGKFIKWTRNRNGVTFENINIVDKPPVPHRIPDVMLRRILALEP